ncbi:MULTISPECIES: nuclear transport factor 2 family protein [unclassified Rhodococcus (in: high G+C Gram-positive bacteria)]|uniref:nuclear transport factor 2 family protein n=1 Tax=unclassified Rhodococcus (in: high G+C Gram-positive bacteria) TaxID=192944 RepID=UPI000E0A1B84|nr:MULTISPECIES: nuclear transport factor 2 family protein [unclassified Rhodococcus (in: high G+C Gram-positive bacteria)]QKT10568.1 nuclear transport factor 2 family protein [Rhodococcus sp. W8901]RDI35710.1 SnoaL-like protein [Rhodococcus sp. AG1013]
MTPYEFRALSDRAEIGDVLHRYYRGVDRRDWALVRSCFFDDAHNDYAPFYQGGVDEFMDFLRDPAGFGLFDRTFHFVGNMLIELAGDSDLDTADAETYVMAQHTSAADAGNTTRNFLTVWLRYLDRFERREGRWAIADRRIEVEWIRNDVGGMWMDVPGQAPR